MNRITQTTVQQMMDTVVFQTWRIPHTNATVAAAVLPDGYVLATGMAADTIVDDARQAAVANAQKKAEAKCWELLGWELKMALKQNAGWG